MICAFIPPRKDNCMARSTSYPNWLTSILMASAMTVMPGIARAEVWTEVSQPPSKKRTLQWSTWRTSDKNKITKGVIWSSVPPIADKEGRTNTLTQTLVWKPLQPNEVITEDDIIPLSDLEDVQLIAIDRPTAYSRGSMIQIGETVYPNLGFNALQRHPDSYTNAALVAIDDSRVGSPDCRTGDFFDSCADGLLEARLRLWNSPALSFDLHWTMHSLSGEGSPFNFTVGDQTFGDDDGGTKFGEGQSIGFVASKNLGKTFGLTFAGYRLFHLDEVTDLPRNFALYGTKIFRLNGNPEPPIISLSLGLMTDVYNTETNLGSITYPDFLRGGEFRSNFAEIYGNPTGSRRYYEDVAGVSSAFVCADQTVFAPFNGKKFKPADQADPNCIKKVYFGPIASIGLAPWPWLGVYAKYSGTDVDLGISLKPFKNIPWTFSLEALNPIKGINPILDASYDAKECLGKNNSTFSDCRTRIGIFTELSF